MEVSNRLLKLDTRIEFETSFLCVYYNDIVRPPLNMLLLFLAVITATRQGDTLVDLSKKRRMKIEIDQYIIQIWFSTLYGIVSTMMKASCLSLKGTYLGTSTHLG